MAGVAASFIVDPDKYAVCSLAGIPTFAGKIIEFEKIAAALRNQLPVLENEKNRAVWLKHGLFAAQLVKAACDGFIATADAIVDTPQTNAIAKAYGVTSDLAGAASAMSTIGMSHAEMAKVALNTTAAAIKGRVSDKDYADGVDALIDLQKTTSTMLIDISQKDADATISDLVSVTAAMGKLGILKIKSEVKQKLWKRLFGAGEAIVNTARGFARSYREMKENDDDKMFENLKKSLNQQIKMFELKIAELHRAIYDYENERASRLRSPMAAHKPPMPHAAKHR